MDKETEELLEAVPENLIYAQFPLDFFRRTAILKLLLRHERAIEWLLVLLGIAKDCRRDGQLFSGAPLDVPDFRHLHKTRISKSFVDCCLELKLLYKDKDGCLWIARSLWLEFFAPPSKRKGSERERKRIERASKKEAPKVQESPGCSVLKGELWSSLEFSGVSQTFREAGAESQPDNSEQKTSQLPTVTESAETLSAGCPQAVRRLSEVCPPASRARLFEKEKRVDIDPPPSPPGEKTDPFSTVPIDSEAGWFDSTASPGAAGVEFSSETVTPSPPADLDEARGKMRLRNACLKHSQKLSLGGLGKDETEQLNRYMAATRPPDCSPELWMKAIWGCWEDSVDQVAEARMTDDSIRRPVHLALSNARKRLADFAQRRDFQEEAS